LIVNLFLFFGILAGNEEKTKNEEASMEEKNKKKATYFEKGYLQ